MSHPTEIKELGEIDYNKKYRVGGMVKKSSIYMSTDQISFIITDFENEINEIENLKSLKRDSTIYNNEENSNNFFKNPLIIAIIVIIFLAIFVYP